jgi:hypothetical protein
MVSRWKNHTGAKSMVVRRRSAIQVNVAHEASARVRESLGRYSLGDLTCRIRQEPQKRHRSDRSDGTHAETVNGLLGARQESPPQGEAGIGTSRVPVGYGRADRSGPGQSSDRSMELGRVPKGSEWRSVPSISIARAPRTRHERTGRRAEHHFDSDGQTERSSAASSRMTRP